MSFKFMEVATSSVVSVILRLQEILDLILRFLPVLSWRLRASQFSVDSDDAIFMQIDLPCPMKFPFITN